MFAANPMTRLRRVAIVASRLKYDRQLDGGNFNRARRRVYGTGFCGHALKRVFMVSSHGHVDDFPSLELTALLLHSTAQTKRRIPTQPRRHH